VGGSKISKPHNTVEIFVKMWRMSFHTLFVGAAWLQVARKAILLRCRCVLDYEVSVFSDLACTHALTHILRRFLFCGINGKNGAIEFSLIINRAPRVQFPCLQIDTGSIGKTSPAPCGARFMIRKQSIYTPSFLTHTTTYSVCGHGVGVRGDSAKSDRSFSK
jgi:hypothetical protein